MSEHSLSKDNDLNVDGAAIYNVFTAQDEVQLSGDLDAALRFTHEDAQIRPTDADGPTPAKRENIREPCMYSIPEGQRSESGGMFAYSGDLNQSGTRGETMPQLPTGYQGWSHSYRQPADSLHSDLSMDACMSVNSLNPNLNQAASYVTPSATPSLHWTDIKFESKIQQPEIGNVQSDVTTQMAAPGNVPGVDQGNLQPKAPTPDDYRQYIKKLYLENLQRQPDVPMVQQSELQSRGPVTSPTEEMMPSSPRVTVETVVYHQELDENGECPLHHLSQSSEVKVMATVIGCMQQCGVLNQCVNLPNKLQQTPLFLAVQAGNITMTTWLVKNGADPTIQGTLHQERDIYIYRSPIHLAVMMGDVGMRFMQTLLQSPKVTNLNEATIGDKLSPLHLALISHKPGFSCKQMILALIDAGADIDLVVPSNGKTPLILALETRDFSLVTEILDRLNPDRCRSVLLKQTRSGDTCLHIAAGLTNISSEQKEWLLRLLVTKGANGNIPNNAKEYPKDFARKEQLAGIQIYLSANIRQTDNGHHCKYLVNS